MKFAVIGGDRRSVLLCRSLAGDGHRVHSFALEHAELPPEIPKAGCLQGCLYGADVAVLPTPAEKSGLLNAPYAAAPCRMDALIETLWPGQLLCGGLLGEERVLAAVKGGLTVRDFMKTPGFVTANAALTAEGAVALLLQESERALLGSRALVCGWGRIGRVRADLQRAVRVDAGAVGTPVRGRGPPGTHAAESSCARCGAGLGRGCR